MKNHEDSIAMHNVDFHAVTGLHGGGHATMAAPGETKGFTFQALNAGLYVYHCAVGPAAQHIANACMGLILDRTRGVVCPPVDREFYVMQGRALYLRGRMAVRVISPRTMTSSMNETPEYYVFNGADMALTGDNALHAEVGETIRIYFGVGGPNKTSSFHVIGEIFDKVYNLGLADRRTLARRPDHLRAARRCRRGRHEAGGPR